ncbi:MAG: cysteine--tRNA ligase [Anaerolineales bacterium]
MGLRIFNTLSRMKEPFETVVDGQVRMYVCGPTVYDQAHIGHAMSSIVFDVIRRYLEYRAYQVRHVMNYTDVDDKVIARANELGQDPIQLAQHYVEEYERQLHELNILPPGVQPRVSGEIDDIVGMVKRLLEGGHAYRANGDVYFDVERDPNYGKLSGRKLEEMQAGARLEIDKRKRNPADFALWKSAKPGEPSWESPWGRGRPGWHIECSAMSLHHLGDQIDIHGGGNDLIFPHHENEIAQTESLTGRQLSRYWVHNGMMQLNGETMSKSTGNMLPISEFLQQHEAEVLRLIVLNSHYRSPLAFSSEIAEAAAKGLERLRSALKPAETGPEGAGGPAEQVLSEAVKTAQAAFEAAMDDDFNTPQALGGIYELVRSTNLARDKGVGQPSVQIAQQKLLALAGVLGLRLAGGAAPEPRLAEMVDLLMEIRDELRAAEQWELADRIRQRLAAQGIQLEDGKHGTSWRQD